MVEKNARPTLSDVARLAGVSPSSASRVFLGQKKVSEETRRRVLKVANEIGYVPHSVSRRVALKDNRTIGLLLRDAANPTYGSLFSELHLAAAERGWGLATMTVATGKHDHVQIESLYNLVGMQVAGLIVSTGDLPSELLAPFLEQVPILRAGRPEPQGLVHAVSYDAEAAGRTLARLVLGEGHIRIAVIRTRKEISLPEWLRAEAMITTIRAAGLEPFVVEVGNNTGEEYILPLVQSGAVSVVMCPTDLRQLAFLRLFDSHGLNVPEDVSVTGCDGALHGADILGLTTYRWPIRRLAQATVDSIIGLIQRYGTPDNPRELISIKIPGEVVRGRTLAASTAM